MSLTINSYPKYCKIVLYYKIHSARYLYISKCLSLIWFLVKKSVFLITTKRHREAYHQFSNKRSRHCRLHTATIFYSHIWQERKTTGAWVELVRTIAHIWCIKMLQFIIARRAMNGTASIAVVFVFVRSNNISVVGHVLCASVSPEHRGMPPHNISSCKYFVCVPPLSSCWCGKHKQILTLIHHFTKLWIIIF